MEFSDLGVVPGSVRTVQLREVDQAYRHELALSSRLTPLEVELHAVIRHGGAR